MIIFIKETNKKGGKMAKKLLMNNKTLLIVATVLAVAVIVVSAVGSGALQGFSVLTDRGNVYNAPSCTDSDHGKTKF